MRPLSRRAMLKGMLGGAVVSVGLPPLAAMMNGNGTAYAGASSFPKRFGVWFWGNGVLPDDWVPASEGKGYAFSPILSPLASVREHVLLITGTRVATLNTSPHEAGPAGLLTGDQPRHGTYSRATIDQTIAAKVGAETRFRSLEVGVQRATRSLSHSGPNAMNPTEADPTAIFTRLFGDGFRRPGTTSEPDPRLGLDRSVLDAVREQSHRLRARLGVADRRRLDEHLEGIAIIERQIKRQQENPPVLAACQPPDEAPPVLPDVNGRPDMRERSKLISELVAMALACDQTRVFFDMYSQPVNNTLFGDTPAGHHQLTHDEGGDQPTVRSILQLIMADFATFLTTLKNVQEGDGTLLDNTLVLATTDCGYGRNHSLDEYPILLAGGAATGIRLGEHLRARDENACKVSLAILQAMAVRTSEFGVGEGHVTTPLAGVLA
jgi:hypothetical protein